MQDFATRFYTMSTTIVQHYDEWAAKNVSVAGTAAGQFLIKSGPDLWRMSRKVGLGWTRAPRWAARSGGVVNGWEGMLMAEVGPRAR